MSGEEQCECRLTDRARRDLSSVRWAAKSQIKFKLKPGAGFDTEKSQLKLRHVW